MFMRFFLRFLRSLRSSLHRQRLARKPVFCVLLALRLSWRLLLLILRLLRAIATAVFTAKPPPAPTDATGSVSAAVTCFGVRCFSVAGVALFLQLL